LLASILEALTGISNWGGSLGSQYFFVSGQNFLIVHHATNKKCFIGANAATAAHLLSKVIVMFDG
jgi:hypothetical protein